MMQPKNFRKMGVDYGKARVGIAFSDLSGTIASADHIFKTSGNAETLQHLARLVAEKDVDTVVFGLPLNADGTESDMSAQVRQFAQALESCLSGKNLAVKIAFQDERYTSFEAEELLKEAGVKWEKRKELLDKISAQIILQNYMDENK